MVEAQDMLMANHNWLVKHARELDKYSGKWIAIEESRLIAVADTLKDLGDKTEVKSAKHPLFHYVPDIQEDEILIL